MADQKNHRANQKRILLSGFDSFAQAGVNPSGLLMKEFEVAKTENVKSIVLPVVFATAFQLLKAEILAFKPDVILSFGVAVGRSPSIDFERTALNLNDSEVADNAGQIIRQTPIELTAPNALFSTLPLGELIEACVQVGVRARISESAGTYVCNDLFFRLQEYTRYSARCSGFIHIPELSVIDLASLVRATEAMLACMGLS